MFDGMSHFNCEVSFMILIYDLLGVFYFGISVKTKDAVGTRVYRAFGLYSEFEK